MLVFLYKRRIRILRQRVFAQCNEGTALNHHRLFVDGIEIEDIIRQLDHKVGVGGKVLLLNPGTMATFLYPQYIKGVLDAKGEIMNMDIPESPIFDGLEPLDLRYFNNNRPESPAVCAGSFQIIRQPNLSAPASFTKVHGYLQGEIGQREAALEKLRGFPIVRIDDKGCIILSQVMTDKASTDPVAGRLLTNMIGLINGADN
jgi:beta-galactosidase